LNRAIDRLLAGPEYADTTISGVDRTAFRKVIFAIRANKGQGEDNPGRLLEIVEQVLGPDAHVRIAALKR
jgi:hypothetical protein